MTDRIPSTRSTEFALWLVGFNQVERQAILEAAARVVLVQGVYVDPVRLVAWLIEIGKVTFGKPLTPGCNLWYTEIVTPPGKVALARVDGTKGTSL